MKRVYKYEFKITDDFSIDLPRYSKVLTCKKIENQFFMWVLIDMEMVNDLETRNFRLAGTGHDIVETDWTEYEYIATIEDQRGFDNNSTNFIWHIFEVIVQGKND